MAGKYYKDKVVLFGDPRAVLFRLPASKVNRRYWHFRYRLKRQKKYYQVSTKEVSFEKAVDVARKIWRDILDTEEHNIDFGNRSFPYIVKQFLKENSFNQNRSIRIKHTLEKYLLDFWNGYNIDDINHKEWVKYLKWRLNYYMHLTDKQVRHLGATKIIAKTTLDHERQLLVQILRWCARNNWLKSVPMLGYEYQKYNLPPRIRYEKTRGKAIDDRLFKEILAKLFHYAFWDRIELAKQRKCSVWDITRSDAEEWVRNNGELLKKLAKTDTHKSFPHDKNRNFARKRVYAAVICCFNTLLRPTREMSSLKWRDVRIERSRTNPELQIVIIKCARGKKGPRTAIGTYRYVKHILRWRQICYEYGFGNDDDFIFPRWNGEEMPFSELGRTFSLFLRNNGLNQNITGERITLYSVRNTAISSRIKNSSWDLLRLSEAADTSIMTISKSYASDIKERNADKYANTFHGDIKLPRKDIDEIDDLLESVWK